MSTLKTLNQNRQYTIKRIAFSLFFIMTFGLSLFLEYINSNSIAWLKDYKEVSGRVIDIIQLQAGYQNRKSKNRYSTDYYLSYQFEVNNNYYRNEVEVSSSVYYKTKKGDNLTVWYANNSYYISDLKENAELDLSNNNIMDNIITAALFTIPTSLLLYWLMVLLFVRETKKSLLTDLYTETS